MASMMRYYESEFSDILVCNVFTYQRLILLDDITHEFLDTYDIAPESTPESQNQQQTLSEEVNQVVGQLGRFWGGFRKQSQTAFQAAKKDFGEVVVQAQKEISKLAVVGEASQSSSRQSQPTETTSDTPASNDTTSPADSTTTLRGEDSTLTPSQNLLSRLQSALPPNIVSTVNSHLPESLKHASDNIDISQLRSTLLTEFQRVQGVTRAQAEEYVHKSESFLRDAIKEANEVLREAVKVIPPGDAADNESPGGLVWDGTDVWMVPSETGGAGKGKASESSGENQRTVATRAEALLRRLKTDPLIIRHDPEGDAASKQLYTSFLAEEIDSQEGGIEGDTWEARILEVLEDSDDGQALKNLEQSLVPSEMTKATFWCRFFFREHQIRQEEKKRQALLSQTAAESEEDFSWEDEEESSYPQVKSDTKVSDLSHWHALHTYILSFKTTKETEQNLAPPSEKIGSASPSTRVSSEDSFDVVSSNVSVAGDSKTPSVPKEDSSDADSDWE
ncbi:hypothetical protein BDQ17DRAFT_1387181 [Cyathus striatus]|nr:hypothetical protein BDQ17DRAFT_1387181 [Cyathus striatus]